jgi:hypothetical protein
MEVVSVRQWAEPVKQGEIGDATYLVSCATQTGRLAMLSCCRQVN